MFLTLMNVSCYPSLMIKIKLSNFIFTKSKYSISKGLSRHLGRNLYRSYKPINLESADLNYDEFLRQVPKQSSQFDKFFLKANFKLIVRIAVLIPLLFTRRKLQNYKSVSLIYGLSYEQIHFGDSTSRLQEFLLSKKIGLSHNDLFYVANLRHNIISKKSERIRMCKNISTSLFHDFLSFTDKLRVVLLVSQRLVKYLVMLIYYPIVVHAAQAYVVDDVIFNFLIRNRKIKLIDLIATPSIITNLPYIFDSDLHLGKRIMIWYSANSVPINYRDKNLERTNFNEKYFEFMPLDLHLVWNQLQKDYLDSVISPPIPVEVRGSLMFYLPQEQKISTKEYDIMIFDVTPYESSRKSEFDNIPISQNSIYSDHFATKFLQDLLWSIREIEGRFGTKLRVALKPKRHYTPLHSRKYLAFLECLSESGFIEILEPESDLYKIINESRISINYPFSSPAIIARELNIPTVYFLPSDSINYNSVVDGIEFITDRNKLLDFIMKYRNTGQ